MTTLWKTLAKISLFIVLTFIADSAKATSQELRGEEIFRAENTQGLKDIEASRQGETEPGLRSKKKNEERNKKLKETLQHNTSPQSTNLPDYFKIPKPTSDRRQDLLVKETKISATPAGLPDTGSTVVAIIPHSLVAFLGEKVPVIAHLRDRKYHGLALIGYTRLEPNSRRIFVEFTSIQKGQRELAILATGFDFDGNPGLRGHYHSREDEYFWGEFVSSFVAGYFESLIPKRTTIFGTTLEPPSMDNALKRGLSSGAISSADRFKEKLKMAPQFSELPGPTPVQIVIVRGPKTKS